jgi:hypothetical protein
LVQVVLWPVREQEEPTLAVQVLGKWAPVLALVPELVSTAMATVLEMVSALVTT